MTQAVLRVVAKEDSEKKRALDAALSQIDRAFGKGSVMRLGQREKAVDTDAVSTGSLGLDIAARHRRPAPRPGDRDLRS
jgi:recombination protein RecA